MRILELFSGTESFSNVARAYGGDCTTIDNDPSFKPSIVKDLRFPLELPEQYSGCFDIIWASPPCVGFSVASIGKHWEKGRIPTPKTETARDGLRMLNNTLDIITYLKPRFFFIENPRGMMRKMPRLTQLEAIGFLKRDTVTYCQYGDTRMKPTDIWNNCWNWRPRKACKNGDPCHESAPRGSRTGTQGLKGGKARAVVPRELCLEIFLKCMEEINCTFPETKYTTSA